jgi:hypothetical protein
LTNKGTGYITNARSNTTISISTTGNSQPTSNATANLFFSTSAILTPVLRNGSIHSVLIDTESKLSSENSLNLSLVDYISFVLKKSSSVFFTDINLYDTHVEINELTNKILDIIHLPGLRSIPKRDYPSIGVNERFLGIFDNYFASIIYQWRITQDSRIEKLNQYIESRTIQIAPLAFMRGRTLDNAFVILDEAQNTTESQMKMFLTRMGSNAKFIVTGDLTQIDLPSKQPSGLIQAVRLLKKVDGISVIELDNTDVIRHKLVRAIIEQYEAK